MCCLKPCSRRRIRGYPKRQTLESGLHRLSLSDSLAIWSCSEPPVYFPFPMTRITLTSDDTVGCRGMCPRSRMSRGAPLFSILQATQRWRHDPPIQDEIVDRTISNHQSPLFVSANRHGEAVKLTILSPPRMRTKARDYHSCRASFHVDVNRMIEQPQFVRVFPFVFCVIV